jgi:hypothetical protein
MPWTSSRRTCPADERRDHPFTARAAEPKRKLVEMVIGTQVGFLNDVRGFGIISDDCARYSINPLAMAAEEEFEKVGPAGSHSTRDLVVRKGFAPLLLGR